jgi:hypothetical protein
MQDCAGYVTEQAEGRGTEEKLTEEERSGNI